MSGGHPLVITNTFVRTPIPREISESALNLDHFQGWLPDKGKFLCNI